MQFSGTKEKKINVLGRWGLLKSWFFLLPKMNVKLPISRVGCSERIALKQVYYQGLNRSQAQVGYMRQVLRAGALGRPRGMGWGRRRVGGSGWGTHVNPWLIHVNVWKKTTIIL